MSKDGPRFLIYGLIDPRSLLIRYIGLSSSGLRRPRNHRRPSCPDSHCRYWVRQLQKIGLDYEITVLEIVSSQGELPAAERWWIAYGRASGWPLTNLTVGGAPSAETLLKLRQRQIERDTAASAYMRAWYSAEDIEACRQHLGIPAEIEKRCLQFFDQHFTYKRRHKIVDDAVERLCITRQTARQVYAKWLDLKRTSPTRPTEPIGSQVPDIKERCAPLFAQGKSIAETATELKVSPKAVKRFYTLWIRTSCERGRAALAKDREVLLQRLTDELSRKPG